MIAEAGDDHLADVVDAGVRRGVDLEDVDVAPFGDLDAGVADAAGIGGRPVRAVQRARQDPRRRRLADAARPGEHERLRQPPARQRVAQRTRHRLLSDDIVEPLRPPFARDDLVGHWTIQIAECRVQIEACCGLNRGPEGPAAHVRICLALLPSGPDAVRRLKLHRFRTAVQSANRRVYYTGTRVASSRYFASTSPTTTVKKST